jgi:hypothetical protein
MILGRNYYEIILWGLSCVGSGMEMTGLSEGKIIRVVGVLLQHLSTPLSENSGPALPIAHLRSASVIKHGGSVI